MPKRQSKLAVIALSAFFATTPLSAAGYQGGYGGNGGTTSVVGELDEFETPLLVYMREEEKLARDLYLGLYDQFDAAIFANIADSEQRHMDAIEVLLDRYVIDDPASAEIGNFNDEELQSLYDVLLADGGVSYEAALMAGALVEETDIADLQEALDTTDNEDLIRVYSNLMRGSRNHLRAFVAEMARISVDADYAYVARVLTQDEVDDILGQARETGGNGGAQGGRGKAGRN